MRPLAETVDRADTLTDYGSLVILHTCGPRVLHMACVLSWTRDPSPLSACGVGVLAALTRRSFGVAGLPRGQANFRARYPGLDEVSCDLLQRMLALNPSERITAAEALAHPYFAVRSRGDQHHSYPECNLHLQL